MALLAPKLNSADVWLKYISRIEAVAYPYFQRIAPDDQMTSGEPEEYKYILGLGIKSHYLVEGHFRYLPLDDNQHAFLFQIENPLKKDWRLALGEAPSRISGPATMILPYYFKRKNIGKPARRKEIGDFIATVIEHEFLHQDHGSPFEDMRSPAYIQFLLTSVRDAAGPDYQHTLEQHLIENPRKPILPQKYRYDIDGKIFDKAKLMRA